MGVESPNPTVFNKRIFVSSSQARLFLKLTGVILNLAAMYDCASLCRVVTIENFAT